MRGRRRLQRRPEDPVNDDDHEQEAVVGEQAVAGKAETDDAAGNEQRPSAPDSIGDRTGDRGRQGRRVREEPEKETRREGRASQIANPEGHRRQQLKVRQAHHEIEAAHDQ